MSSLSRIDRRFAALKSAGRPALIPFMTAGDPDPTLTVPAMHALVAAGADLIELGMPFSDPMADGPVIQQANERAIAKGVGLKHVLDSVRDFRAQDRDTPLVLMGYLNPIEQYGREAFIADAAVAGADALLMVDCPVDESADMSRLLGAQGLKQIHLVAPTTSPSRQQRIAAAAQGFLYYVSLKGITGAARLETGPVQQAIEGLKRLTEVPVCVGFGVRDADSARALGSVADGVVIGSALVEQMAGATDAVDLGQRIAGFLGPIRTALERVPLAA